MRTIYITLISLLVSIYSEAQLPTESLTSAEHLVAINAQWEGKPISEREVISFQNENERIAYHLGQVIARLESTNSQDAQIAARRNELIRTLKTYQLAGQFPINTGHAIRTPYFIDDFGTACAVGHLMIESGHAKLAYRIKGEHNFDYIADIKTYGVLEWAAAYGFTLDELALIQPQYPPTNQMSAIGEGVNGPVTNLLNHLNERLYLAGEFTQLDGTIPCEGKLAYIEDGDYHCLDDGPIGDIRMLVRGNSTDLLICGGLQFEGQNYPVAKFSNGEWEYYSIPERPNAIGKSLRYSSYNYSELLIAIDLQDGTGHTEIWRYDSDEGTWHLAITCLGDVLTIEGQYYIYIGGNFDSYIDHLENDEVMACDGLIELILSAWNEDVATPQVSEFLPDVVTSVLSLGEVLYVGGICDEIYPNTYLSRFQNGVFQALIYDENGLGIQDIGIYDIAYYDSGHLLIAGDLSTDENAIISNNLGVYNLLYGYMGGIGLFDGAVKCIAAFDDDWYVAGDFTSNVGYTLNHIAKIGAPTGLIEDDQLSMTLNPNPAQDYFDIRFEEPIGIIESMQVYGLDGRTHSVLIRQSGQLIHVEVPDLKPGIYLYRIETQVGNVSGRFVKE